MRELIDHINNPIIRTLVQYCYMYPVFIGVILGITRKAIRLGIALIVIGLIVFGYLNWDQIKALLPTISKA